MWDRERSERRLRMRTWASARNVRPSKSRACVRRLWGERCYSGEPGCTASRRGWSRHASLWTREGRPAVLVSHVEGIARRGLLELVGIARERDLHLLVSGESWFWPGRMLQIEVWAPGLRP